MTQTIHLGYTVGTGEPVEIPLKHLVVTGQTQESGKTTTLEALISRSGCRAIAFVTKRFERSFTQGQRIQPYFRQRADWQFVASILEATMRERFRYERPWIVRVTKQAQTLDQVHAKIRKAMEKSREGSRSHDVYLMLNEYLNIVVPALAQVRWAPSLELQPGLNVMDLSAMPPELHSLVIGSAIEWVYEHERDTIVVIPEAWEFLPQERSSPVKLACEHLIRKGAGGGNYVWLDSQDLAAVDASIRKSVIVWLLGVQREENEVRRVLKHVSAAKKPKTDDVMQLGRGEFYACWGNQAIKAYVQPAWMNESQARQVAEGALSADVAARLSPSRPIQNLQQNVQEMQQNAHEEPTMSVEKKLDQLTDLLTRFVSQGQAAQAAVNQAGTAPAQEPTKALPPLVSTNGQVTDSEALYQSFKARLLADAEREPALLRILTQRPELEVQVERQVIEADGNSPEGRIGLLITEGFFDDTATGQAVFNELKRRGARLAKPTAYDWCRQLVRKGFLTEEQKGKFKVVAGAKVRVREK